MGKLYTCEEIAEMYGVSMWTVWSWIRIKKLTAIKTGKFYRIRQCDVDSFNERYKTV